MRKLLGILGCFCLVFSAIQSFAEPITLRLSTVIPAQANPVTKCLKPWSEQIAKASEGSLKIEIYAGGVLGSNVKMYLQQLESGVFDIALLYPTYFGERFSDLDICYVPFTAETYLEGALGVQRLTDKGLIRGFEDLVVIMNIATSPFYLNTTFPLKLPADLKGHKIRTGNKLQAEIMSSLGATPFDMPINKGAENLSRKLIEGTIESPDALKVFGGYKIARNHLLVPMGSSSLAIVMNKKKYESLPPKARAILDKFRGEYLARFWAEQLTPIDTEELVIWGKDPSHKIITPTAAEKDAWKKALQPAIDNWEKSNPEGAKLFKAYNAELSKIRSGR